MHFFPNYRITMTVQIAQHLTKLGLHIDYVHSISLGYSYYLILVVDGIDFVWGQTCTTRSTPEEEKIVMEPVVHYTHIQNV